jgi:hypothetical protein
MTDHQAAEAVNGGHDPRFVLYSVTTYSRRAMGQQERICEWCSRTYTDERSGSGRPPPYCSDTCKHAAQKSLAANRMRRLREKQREQNPSRRPPGRPRSR